MLKAYLEMGGAAQNMSAADMVGGVAVRRRGGFARAFVRELLFASWS